MSARWWLAGVVALTLGISPMRADSASDKKEAELDRVPEEWREVAQRLGDIDRSDASISWTELRDFKNQYHLFRPTPRALRREFVTDRPDKTINPVTVDAGHVQVETDLVAITVDRWLPKNARAGGARFSGSGGFNRAFPTTFEPENNFKFLYTNVRIGLMNNLELQVFTTPFQYLDILSPSAPSQTFGFGDMRTLLKANLWGNEGGSTAACAVGFMDIPAGRSGLTTGIIEAGGLFAFLLRLPGKTYISVEFGAEARHDSADSRYHLEIPESISIATSFTKELSSKIEFASVLTTEEATSWFGVLAIALLYQFEGDFQVDVGVNIGVTPNAPDWQPYLGLSKRF